MVLARDGGHHPAAPRLAGVRDVRAGEGRRAVGWPDLADRGPVPSRGLRDADRLRKVVPVGQRATRRAARQLRLPTLGPHPRHRHAAGGQRLRRVATRRQRMGMDDDTLSALSRLPTLPVLSRLFGAFLRRSALRAEGGLAADGGAAAAPVVPQLVPTELPLRLRRLPVRGKLMQALMEFAREVREGLGKPGQKELPSKYLYDELGTALFEAITVLPEYGLTRAGDRLLRRYSPDILERLPPPVVVAELGSGSGRKTRWILEALARREPVTYFPIDLLASALVRCEQGLADLPSISVVGLEAPYLDGIRHASSRRRSDQTLLVLFLGSNIGNFDRPAADVFLLELRQCMKPGDALLLATDLEKPVADLILAYDDPAGVTAAFNLNL